MREISLVKKLKFDFQGSIAKRALVIGDADNDQQNELVCANLQGDLAVFKDKKADKFAYASDLGMVTACLVGDVTNSGKNHVAAINTEGWLFVFDLFHSSSSEFDSPTPNTGCGLDFVEPLEPVRPHSNAGTEPSAIELVLLHSQRVPANCKELLLADLDGDGQNEIIIGLTDRVLRTYQWIKLGPDRGKFVGLYKWEFADQIGSVSLNPSRHDNCLDIIVAQPGGTYAKLECVDKKASLNSDHSASSSSLGSNKLKQLVDDGSQNKLDCQSSSSDNVRTEYISKLTPEYHQLALSQMRNSHISTEVLGGIRNGKDSELYSLIVVATLDGTLMLVDKDEILWSLQVDHQLFALASLETASNCNETKLSQSESTCTIVPTTGGDLSPGPNRPNLVGRRLATVNKRSQYFAVCAWNGKTYIVDEERNYLRFKFDEAVSAFTAGSYHFEGRNHSALVYATFNNRIVVYYDVIVDRIRPIYLLDEVINNPEHSELLERLEFIAHQLEPRLAPTQEADKSANPLACNDNSRAKLIREILRDILYGITDDELTAALGAANETSYLGSK